MTPNIVVLTDFSLAAERARAYAAVLAAPIKAELHLSDTELGVMGGLSFALFYTALGLPIALLADRWSRTWIMTIALTLWSACTAAWPAP